MRKFNHLVLAGHDLGAMQALYADLGFTLTPRAQHPFGTGNAVIQLPGCYLELLSVTRPQDVVDHAPGHYSFSAFNRDYLARHEGFSMLVFDSQDAEADAEAWHAAGLHTFVPFRFSRGATLPDGTEITVGFALAYLAHPDAPWLGHFACQHFSPDYYEQPRYLAHDNTARGVRDVWVCGEGALGLADHFAIVTGARGTHAGSEQVEFATPAGTLVLASDAAFERAFGVSPPHPADGPHLAGLTIRCASLDFVRGHGLEPVGDRLVLSSERGFGTVLAFSA